MVLNLLLIQYQLATWYVSVTFWVKQITAVKQRRSSPCFLTVWIRYPSSCQRWWRHSSCIKSLLYRLEYTVNPFIVLWLCVPHLIVGWRLISVSIFFFVHLGGNMFVSLWLNVTQFHYGQANVSGPANMIIPSPISSARDGENTSFRQVQ